MTLDTHIDGVQVLFDRPPEGIETVPMLVPEVQPAPFFVRLRLYHVRVVDGNHTEDAPTALRDGKHIYLHPRLAWGW